MKLIKILEDQRFLERNVLAKRPCHNFFLSILPSMHQLKWIRPNGEHVEVLHTGFGIDDFSADDWELYDV
jgi:hypothetical protein